MQYAVVAASPLMCGPVPVVQGPDTCTLPTMPHRLATAAVLLMMGANWGRNWTYMKEDQNITGSHSTLYPHPGPEMCPSM